MVLRLIHAWAAYGGHWAVVDRDNHILDYRISRYDDCSGAILEGRVTEILPHISAALVDIGTPRRGFLRNAKDLTEGQIIRTKVRAEARAEKGAILQRVDDKTPLTTHNPLMDIVADYPLIEEFITDDDESYVLWRHHLKGQVEQPSPLTDYPLADQIDQLFHPVVPLSGGGRIIMETTTTLTTVDVDSGTASPLHANQQAVLAVAQQLRLRNISGAVVIDFIPQGKKNNNIKDLIQQLKDQVCTDPIPTSILGIGPLGLVELRRERRRLSLTDRLSGSDGYALRLLDQLWQGIKNNGHHNPSSDWTLRTSPAVAKSITYLSRDFQGIILRTGRQPHLEVEPHRSDSQGIVEI